MPLARWHIIFCFYSLFEEDTSIFFICVRTPLSSDLIQYATINYNDKFQISTSSHEENNVVKDVILL